jgi:hypothetical protein
MRGNKLVDKTLLRAVTEAADDEPAEPRRP